MLQGRPPNGQLSSVAAPMAGPESHMPFFSFASAPAPPSCFPSAGAAPAPSWHHHHQGAASTSAEARTTARPGVAEAAAALLAAITEGAPAGASSDVGRALERGEIRGGEVYSPAGLKRRRLRQKGPASAGQYFSAEPTPSQHVDDRGARHTGSGSSQAPDREVFPGMWLSELHHIASATVDDALSKLGRELSAAAQDFVSSAGGMRRGVEEVRGLLGEYRAACAESDEALEGVLASLDSALALAVPAMQPAGGRGAAAGQQSSLATLGLSQAPPSSHLGLGPRRLGALGAGGGFGGGGFLLLAPRRRRIDGVGTAGGG